MPRPSELAERFRRAQSDLKRTCVDCGADTVSPALRCGRCPSRYAEDYEAKLDRNRRYRKDNRARVNEWQRNDYARHGDKRRKRWRDWFRENHGRQRELANARMRRYTARKRQATATPDERE